MRPSAYGLSFSVQDDDLVWPAPAISISVHSKSSAQIEEADEGRHDWWHLGSLFSD